MAIIKTKAQQDSSVGRVSEGDEVNLRSTRDGALFVADWKQAMIMEGRGFMVNVGSFSTPAVGGGTSGLVVDIDAPEFCIGVPDGTSIIPLRIEVSSASPVGAADDEEVDILIAVDQDKVNASSSGTSTSETIYNMNSLHSRASNCYANSEYTSTAMTLPVNDLELAHMTKIFECYTTVGAFWQETFLLYEPKTPPILNGPCMLVGYWGGTAITSAFACVQWIELPSSVV